jgi:hypothetical protein
VNPFWNGINFEQTNGGLPTMRITCMQCHRTLKAFGDDDFLKFLYIDEGVYFFCSLECKGRWVPPAVVTAEDLGNLQQSSL